MVFLTWCQRVAPFYVPLLRILLLLSLLGGQTHVSLHSTLPVSGLHQQLITRRSSISEPSNDSCSLQHCVGKRWWQFLRNARRREEERWRSRQSPPRGACSLPLLERRRRLGTRESFSRARRTSSSWRTHLPSLSRRKRPPDRRDRRRKCPATSWSSSNRTPRGSKNCSPTLEPTFQRRVRCFVFLTSSCHCCSTTTNTNSLIPHHSTSINKNKNNRAKLYRHL